MNVQKLFEAVKQEPDQHTLIIVVNELERQRYIVNIADKYNGSVELNIEEDSGDLKYLLSKNGIKIKIKRKEEHKNLKFTA